MNLITKLLGISLMATIGLLAPHTPLEAPVQEVVAEVVYVPDFTTKEGIEAYIRYKFGDSGDIAVKVANCESGLNPHATNEKGRDRSYGIFQVNLYGSLANSRPSKEWLKIAENNIDYSHAMFIKEGWRPWTCHKRLLQLLQKSL